MSGVNEKQLLELLGTMDFSSSNNNSDMSSSVYKNQQTQLNDTPVSNTQPIASNSVDGMTALGGDIYNQSILQQNQPQMRQLGDSKYNQQTDQCSTPNQPVQQSQYVQQLNTQPVSAHQLNEEPSVDGNINLSDIDLDGIDLDNIDLNDIIESYDGDKSKTQSGSPGIFETLKTYLDYMTYEMYPYKRDCKNKFMIFMIRCVQLLCIIFITIGFLLPNKLLMYHVIVCTIFIISYDLFDEKNIFSLLVKNVGDYNNYHQFIPCKPSNIKTAIILVMILSVFGMIVPKYSIFNLLNKMFTFLKKLS
jgi:hypothetical protein